MSISIAEPTYHQIAGVDAWWTPDGDLIVDTTRALTLDATARQQLAAALADGPR